MPKNFDSLPSFWPFRFWCSGDFLIGSFNINIHIHIHIYIYIFKGIQGTSLLAVSIYIYIYVYTYIYIYVFKGIETNQALAVDFSCCFCWFRLPLLTLDRFPPFIQQFC